MAVNPAIQAPANDETGRYFDSLQRFLNFGALFVFVLVIFSGTTRVAGFRQELMMAGAGLCVFSFMVANMRFKLFNVISLVWIYVIIYMLASSLLHSHTSTSLKYVLVYAMCFIAMISGFSKKDYLMFMKLCEIFSIVFAASICIEVVFNGLFTGPLSFIYSSNERASFIQAEINSGMFSGLSGEKGEASYVANILIAVELCEMFSERKVTKCRIILLVLGVIALMLTGKRTMLIIPFAVVIAFVFVNKIKGKYIKVLMVAVVVAAAVFAATLIFPQVAVTIDRIFNSSSDDMLTGRGSLWDVAKSMFRQNVWFGKGFTQFDNYANRDYNVGLLITRMGLDEWTSQAHSMYYQFLGELGILGTVPALGVMAYTLIKTLLMRKKLELVNTGDKTIYHFSLYFQLWFLIYGFTGNVSYYAQDLIMYFIAVGAYLYLAGAYKSAETETNTLRGKDRNDENRYSNVSAGA